MPVYNLAQKESTWGNINPFIVICFREREICWFADLVLVHPQASLTPASRWLKYFINAAPSYVNETNTFALLFPCRQFSIDRYFAMRTQKNTSKANG